MTSVARSQDLGLSVRGRDGRCPFNSSNVTEVSFELFQLQDLLMLWTQYPGSVVPLAMFNFRFVGEKYVEPTFEEDM